jgi:hypothetical protein
MAKSQPIEKIRKRFRKEWLLIAVDKVDESCTLPMTGRLIAHSPWRWGLDEAIQKNIGLELLTIYSTDKLPKGKAFVL